MAQDSEEFEKRFRARLQQYGEHFNLEDLNDANDQTLLFIMIRTELMIEGFQVDIQNLMEAGAAENAANIKKLADLLRDATKTITDLQKTLGIDRKSRRSEDVDSPAEYIRMLKREAKSFIDQRMVKVYCPTCKVLVGRIAPAHNHTAFTVSFQCSQCSKAIRAKRDDKDVMFDVKNADWRRKYRAEIIQPVVKGAETSTAEDDAIAFEIANQVDFVVEANLPRASVSEQPVELEHVLPDIEINAAAQREGGV